MITYARKNLRPFWDALSIVCLPSVQPSVRVNTLFSRLVLAVLNNPHLQKNWGMRRLKNVLRARCAAGEYALEQMWAERIGTSKDPNKELEAFPYYDNYEGLVSREWSLLSQVCRDVKNITFIGSGPLPLTAILLARQYGCQVTLVDANPDAIEQAHRLIRVLGLSHNIKGVIAQAQQYQDFKGVDVVYIAALVGSSPKEERSVYQNLASHLPKRSCVMVRSAHTSRTLLYRPVTKIIDHFFNRVAEMHPHDEVVNSALLFRPYA